ncbi:MAG: glucodextranase DOMON-like domain-containing protein [Acidilobaceae archaeon]
MRIVISLSLLLLIMMSTLPPIASQEPLYVVFIWHYHQPWYYDEREQGFLLPWVRMHSAGSYYKMAYVLSKHPEVKAAFTFSGSLLAQLLDYERKRDVRWEISAKIAQGAQLSTEEKFSMLQIPGGFFDINWRRIVEPVPRFRELRDRAQEAFRRGVALPQEELAKFVTGRFTDQDYLDLACLFNLFWTDPLVLREKYPELNAVRERFLAEREARCTREVLGKVLSAHLEIMREIPRIYAELSSRGQAELVVVPFSHPMSPVLTSFGLSEDLEVHVEEGMRLFERAFGSRPRGIWPPELAVNEDAMRVFSRQAEWSIADDTVLYKSVDVQRRTVAGVEYTERGLWKISFERPFFLFFRNSPLSNLISFTYSNMPSAAAAGDLVSKLRQMARSTPGGIVIIALDGENPWEHYEGFGVPFLTELYRLLAEAQREGVIKMLTPSEAVKALGGRAQELPARPHSYLALREADIADLPHSYAEDAYAELPRLARNARLAEGSWAGGELTVWIGQRAENAAWMQLVKTREDVLGKLGMSLREAWAKGHPSARYLLMAEASDWFWWYGGDGGGVFPSNMLFKRYLTMAYAAAGLEPPHYVKSFFNPDGTPEGTLNPEVPRPVQLKLTERGEVDPAVWREAMKVPVGSALGEALVAVSDSHLLIRLKRVEGQAAIYLTNWWRSVSPYSPGYNSFLRDGSASPMALHYEVLLGPAGEARLSAADGRGGWVELFRYRVARGENLELRVPWEHLSLSRGDFAYLMVVLYSDGRAVERSDRLGSVHLLQVPRAVARGEERVIFEMQDPEGDDKGPGEYSYPLNAVFKQGVFDLLSFKVSEAGQIVRFEVTFRSLGGNPWGGPNGFCLQYVHIYLKVREDGRNDTFGLNVTLAQDSRWNIALLLAPGWETEAVPKGQRAAIYYENGTSVVQGELFKLFADPARNAIVAEVDKGLLLGLNDTGRWRYVVAVASYDGYGPDRIRPVGVDAQEWVVGGGAKHAPAVLFNVAPRVMDLLAENAEAQYKMLSSYVVKRETREVKPAVVSGVGKGEQAPAQPPAQTQVVTEVVRETDWTSLLLSSLLGLAVGALAVAFLLRRR